MFKDLVLDIWALLCEMSPYLLLGFLLAGLMHEFIPNRIYSEYLSKNNFRSVFLAALFGVPLPLCSCGVIPTAMGLRREGGSRGATVAFLISTPQTGVDSIIATYSLMGLPFAVIRPVVAFLTALFGGTMVNAFDGAKEKEQRGKDLSNAPENREQMLEAESGANSSCTTCGTLHSPLHRIGNVMNYAFVEMMEDIGKWLVIGLVVAGLITTLVPDAWFSVFKDNSLLSILLVLAISIPMYVCATGSIPIAVALMMKGLTPGAALVLLMAGPACNVASLLVIRKVLGRRTQLIYLTAIILGAIAFGLGIDYLLPRQWFTSSLLMQNGCCHEEHIGWFSILCTIALLLMLAHALLFHHDHHHHHDCEECATAYEEGSDLSEGGERQVFHIQGMNCNHCASNVERAIRSVAGVTDVSVSLTENSALVSGQFDAAAIKAAIESIGYEVVSA